MAEYTIELRKLIEQGYPLDLESYPIFDESYRPYLNRKIVDHFYFREIGQETPDRFNFFLRRTMNEIMPYYNQMYESELMKYDPLATEYYIRQRDDTLNVSRETNEKGNRKVGETTGQVFTGSTDNKNVSNLVGAHDETTNGAYTKKGDDVKDRDRTENETLNEKITANSLTTNDLKGTSNTTTDTTTHRDTSALKSSVFSDLPQSNITTSVSVSAESPGTYAASYNGYATTTTNDNSSGKEDGTESSTADNHTTSTGTVNVDGDSNRDQTTATTEHETIKDLWNENGTDQNILKYNETQNTDDYTLTKEDTETNTNRNEKTLFSTKNMQTQEEISNQIITSKGRAGFAPADLMQKYRESLINIDLLIIADLEKLFMGVY